MYGAEWRVEELLGGTWAVLRNGWQQGGLHDPQLGCGTKEFPTREDAQLALDAWKQEEENEAQRYLRSLPRPADPRERD